MSFDMSSKDLQSGSRRGLGGLGGTLLGAGIPMLQDLMAFPSAQAPRSQTPTRPTPLTESPVRNRGIL